jgi:thioester reductase-like protein
MTDLESTITSVAARCLRSDVHIETGTPFELLGLDSLATIELAAALEAELGCDLPADIIADCTDAKALAVRLMREGIRARAHEDPFDQMFADAVLPDDVRPLARVARTTDLRAARKILLTGATGFLGGALVQELLNTTSATLVCLVRPKTGRLKPASTEGRVGGGRLQPAHQTRIQIVEGNLNQSRLGLSDARYEQLANETDAILHCGAAVNWVFAYSGLRASNVLGTLELLRLACRRSVPFHFISSLSVCYSTEGARVVDENFDGLNSLRGVQLGYAQTKIVAEALVRQAGARGLPVRIYRPALISGHSVTGAFNRDDLISALVRGCVEMGTAPDLDWNLDCEPVDRVAAAIVRLSRARGPVFHLGHERPRHWRECVLWMRMYGYDVRLLSYHAWLRQLERETRPETAGGPSHPLRPLRSFFLERPAGAGGLTLPELYEERRRVRASGIATRALLDRTGNLEVPLDAALLEKYFRAFRLTGDLPDPSSAGSSPESTHESLSLDNAFFSRLLNAPISRVEVLRTGSDDSIVSELTAWRSRKATGLFHVRLCDSEGGNRDAMVKVKARDTDVIAVGEALAELVDPAVGREYRRFSDRIGFAASHAREIEVYRQRDPRFRRHSPALLGSIVDDSTRTWVAVVEYINDAVVSDSAGQSTWRAAHIESAIDGLAALHSIWLGRETELRAQPWVGYVQSANGVSEMSGLWSALADHAAPLFSSWADPDIASIQRRLISSLDRWWPALETAPRTLIHNDFNPRNVCLRGAAATLCAYDWELATIGAPQRDLAEFLCFVLPPDATLDDITRWVEHHRVALEQEHGCSIHRELWLEGFRSGLYDLLINRLSIYAVVHRVRRQAFLPRIIRTWRNMYQLFPLERPA